MCKSQKKRRENSLTQISKLLKNMYKTTYLLFSDINSSTYRQQTKHRKPGLKCTWRLHRTQTHSYTTTHTHIFYIHICKYAYVCVSRKMVVVDIISFIHLPPKSFDMYIHWHNTKLHTDERWGIIIICYIILPSKCLLFVLKDCPILFKYLQKVYHRTKMVFVMDIFTF